MISDGLQKVGFEILEILWSFYLLIREHSDSDNRLENFKRIKMVQLLTNDIILRLCKFRDKDSRSFSFDQLLKDVKKSGNQERLKKLTEKIKKFREQTKNIQRHRQFYVAHLSKQSRQDLRPITELRPVIKLAVEITDDFCEDTNQYEVGGINLRESLDN